MASPTPTSGLAKTLDGARDIVANIAAWRTWTGAADVAAGKARTYPIGAPSTVTRPFCLVDFEERAFGKIAEVAWRLDGDIVFYFEDAVSDDYTDSHADAWIDFLNNIGAMETGIKGLAGTESYLDLTQITLLGQDLSRIDKEDRQGGHPDVICGSIRGTYWGAG